ncbi:MAG: hypothetical protein ACW98F_19685 [Candidatus Hodarchaeales archaeon]|jgi:hypothetical protein
MKITKRYMTIGLFLFMFLSIMVVNAFPNATILDDNPNDVDKVTWSGLTYDYDHGDYKDDIDIISAAVEESGNDINLSITFQGTPVIDGTHLYWVWLSFDVGGEQGGEDAGAWFYAGGFTSSTPEAFWWVVGDLNDIETYGSGPDLPVIAGNTITWVTNSSYWDDIGNAGSWEVSVWAWTSDGTSYAQSSTLGSNYFDYYPDDDSLWGSTTTTDNEHLGDGGAPGFELAVSMISLIVIPLILKQRRK